MATDLANLKARRTVLTAKIATLGADGLDNPSSRGGGVNPDFEAHKAGLYAELRDLNALIATYEPGIVSTYYEP